MVLVTRTSDSDLFETAFYNNNDDIIIIVMICIVVTMGCLLDGVTPGKGKERKTHPRLAYWGGGGGGGGKKVYMLAVCTLPLSLLLNMNPKKPFTRHDPRFKSLKRPKSKCLRRRSSRFFFFERKCNPITSSPL